MIDCPHIDGANCTVAQSLLDGETVSNRTDKLCVQCSGFKLARQVNQITVFLARDHLNQTGRRDKGFDLWRRNHEHISGTKLPDNPAMPSIATRISRWAQAVAKWVAAGAPVRTKEEMQARVAICTLNECRMFTGTACKLCGCRINEGESAVVNKALMATESCPLGRWPGEVRR